MTKDRYSNVTCPECGHVQLMKVPPQNVCQAFYICKGCRRMVGAKSTCCVVCDYGDMKCTPLHGPLKAS